MAITNLVSDDIVGPITVRSRIPGVISFDMEWPGQPPASSATASVSSD
jgi:hypothetical protein